MDLLFTTPHSLHLRSLVLIVFFLLNNVTYDI